MQKFIKFLRWFLKNWKLQKDILRLTDLCQCIFKVQIFSEGLQNLAHLLIFFWHCLVASNYNWKMGQIFVAFSEYLNFTSIRWLIHRFEFSFFLGKTKQAIWIYDEIKKVAHNKSSNGHVRQKRNWFIFLRQHQRDRIITIFLEVVHPTVSKAGQDKMQPHEFHTASYVQCHSIYIRTVSS